MVEDFFISERHFPICRRMFSGALKRGASLLCVWMAIQMPLAGAYADETYWFRSRPGDQLGTLLSTLQLCPLYGPDRMVERIRALNPKTITPDGRLKGSGLRVVLVSDPRIEAPNAHVKIQSNKEIRFLDLTPKRCLGGEVETRRPANVADAKEPLARIEPSPTPSPIASPSPTVVSVPVIAPAPAPTPSLVAAPPVATQDPESWFGFGVSGAFSRLSGRDIKSGGSATLLTDLSPGTDLSWEVRWSPVWRSEFGVAMKKALWLQPVGRSLESKQSTLTEVGMGVSARFASWARWLFSLSVDQKPTFRAISSTTLSVPKVPMPKAGSGLELILVDHQGYELSVPMKVYYHLGASSTGADYRSGWNEGDAALQMAHERKGCRLEGGVFMRVEKSTSSIVRTQETEMGARLGLSFRFWD